MEAGKRKYFKHWRKSGILVALLFLLVAENSLASHKIKVMALFTDKAMVMIDGQTKVLKKGKAYHGITLISSDSDAVVLQMHGQKKSFKLGSEISTSFKKADPSKELIVWKDSRNMFRIDGSINNKAMKFLIDTGASSIAMSSHAANRIGLSYKQGEQMRATTASGIATGYRVTLNKVKIGHIQIYNVDAVVLNGGYPNEVLLGQTFLSRIHMVRDGDKMHLRKKF